MNATTSVSDRDLSVSPWHAYGVLGAVLAQAGLIPGFGSEGFTSARIRWNGAVELSLDDREVAEALAARLGLPEARRDARRAKSFFPGDDTHRIDHHVWWDGLYAGHEVEIRAYWQTPLGDLVLAEGEELPPGEATEKHAQKAPIGA